MVILEVAILAVSQEGGLGRVLPPCNGFEDSRTNRVEISTVSEQPGLGSGGGGPSGLSSGMWHQERHGICTA